MVKINRITFLGTGGGRFVTFTQSRATGGWILEMDREMLHIDPGPGALVRAKQFGVNLSKLTGVVVSHCHPDHCTDAEVVIEAMTNGVTKKKGILIGNKTVLSGFGTYEQRISSYHQRAVEKVFEMEPEESVKAGNLEITATPTRHSEVKGLGFVFRGSKNIGYTGDGEYFTGQERYFRGCDILILNVLRPGDSKLLLHLNGDGAVKLIRKSKPKLAIIQHFGFLIKDSNAEAKRIENETGIKTIAAKDGQVLIL